MPPVRIDYGSLTFDVVPQGMDQLWSLRRQITVPYSAVISVAHNVHRASTRPEGMRLPGTNWPGLITAGTYWRFWSDDKVRSFWVRHRDSRNCITIRLKNQSYDYLCIEVANPDAEVARMTEAIQPYLKRR